jgi:hypothetical protein
LAKCLSGEAGEVGWEGKSRVKGWKEVGVDGEVSVVERKKWILRKE